MADETFRPRRPQPDEEHNEESMDMGAKIRQQATKHVQEEYSEEPQSQSSRSTPPVPNPMENMAIKGNVPPQMLQAMHASKGDVTEPKKGFNQMRGQENQQENQPEKRVRFDSAGTTNEHLKELLASLKDGNLTYEEIELPSKGRFYDGENGPVDGIVSLRPMTGEEEQILATPRFVRRGQAINMIFQKCLKEGTLYRTENLLTVDRTYLLIYLRGISYTTKYEVEVKCPDCERKFSTTIELDKMFVESCPDEYGPVLQDVLPTTKLPFTYRLSTGKDEQDITDYRDRRIKQFGDSSTDDTLTYRTAALLDEIDGIKIKSELQTLLKNLPISDVSYIRNCINEPPFGVDTNIEITCASCLHDFEVDLPLEANFFFPRRKKG